jgi:hypothetical protein
MSDPIKPSKIEHEVQDVVWTDFKLPEAMWLRGEENFEEWRPIIEGLAQASGMVSGANLTPASDRKFAIQLLRIVAPAVLPYFDYSSGCKTLRRMTEVYQRAGPVQRQKLYDELTSKKYDGGDGLKYAEWFVTTVLKISKSGMILDDSIQCTIFLANIKERLPDWAARMRAGLRAAIPMTFTAIRADFIDETFDLGKKKEKSEKKAHHQGRDSGGKKNSKEVKRRKDGSIVRDGNCNKCGKLGHWERECRAGKTTDNSAPHNGDHSHASTAGSPPPPPPSIGDSFQCSAHTREEHLAELFAIYDEFVRPKKASEGADAVAESYDAIKDVHAMGEITKKTAGLTMMVTQSMSNAGTPANRRERWLFDTGADLRTVNDLKWFAPGKFTMVKKQIPITTGGGMVYPLHIGLVKIPLVGPNKERIEMDCHYTVYIANFPILQHLCKRLPCIRSS